MKLSALLNRLSRTDLIVGRDENGGGLERYSDLELSRVTGDSRTVGPGDVFVAVRGLRADGHDYVEQVIAAGAVAVVVEAASIAKIVSRVAEHVPVISVKNGAAALGEAVALFAGDPAERMTLVGLTGTNGKTTTSYLLEAIFKAAGRSPGIIGTVSYRYAGTDHEAPYTTPVPQVLHQTFTIMANAGVDTVVAEVSSAALSMERVTGTRFQLAAFSNLSQDHLDIHGDMDAYGAAKARLFSERLATNGIAVINIDDPGSAQMLAAAAGKSILRVSALGKRHAEIRVVAKTSTIDGITATIATPRGDIEVVSRQLIGDYNIANVALAVGISVALDIDNEAIRSGLATMSGVPGRVERVANDRGLDVIVDYAHTPDALANVLDALHPLCQRRLICVFGCGGDRDPAKREPMGRAVAERADLCIVTSDNPRTESPQAILDQILPGVPSPFFVEVDRAVAIRAAIAEATRGDIVLIAGKGHEDYQIVAADSIADKIADKTSKDGTVKVHFDDREHAALAISRRWQYSLADIATAIGAVNAEHIAQAGPIDRIIIDGRIAAPGDLYVAIVGDHVDGHDYVEQAVRQGAVAAVVEPGRVTELDSFHIPLLEAGDGRQSLGELGRMVRRRWAKPLIAITGSAGKTTTKDLLRAAFSSLRPHVSRGSLNNETGVPLTLLGLKETHDIAVVEMGMRGLGQIRTLCSFAEPTIGVVTNAGVAHVGVVGSVEDIVRGKSEMFAALPPSGTAIYPANDSRLAAAAHSSPAQKYLSFGDSAEADVRLLSYRSQADGSSQLRISYRGSQMDLVLGLVGRHNALNATCAIAAAIAHGVSFSTAVTGVATAVAPYLRGQREIIGGRHLLIDCYNSNPLALAAALESVAELATNNGTRAFAVIGDMGELGDSAAADHRAAGEQAAKLGIGVVALGQWAPDVVSGVAAMGGSAVSVSDPAAAASEALSRAQQGDWILFKASRSAKLERVVDAVRESAAIMTQDSQDNPGHG